jgi:dynein assembly factor with WDR repeat domains 1
VLSGHTDEVFCSAFNYEGDRILTGSKDNTCRIWHQTAEGRQSDDSDC